MLCGGEDGSVRDAEVDALEAECGQVGRLRGRLRVIIGRLLVGRLIGLLLYRRGALLVGDAISLVLDVLRLTDQLNHQIVILLLFVGQPLLHGRLSCLPCSLALYVRVYNAEQFRSLQVRLLGRSQR